MSFLSNMAVTQATVLLHLRYILQILPCQPLLQNASQDPTADCRDKAPSHPFNVMERQKGMRRNYGRRGGDRETEKCGKENGISPCRCNKKVRLSLPRRPAPSEDFSYISARLKWASQGVRCYRTETFSYTHMT